MGWLVTEEREMSKISPLISTSLQSNSDSKMRQPVISCWGGRGQEVQSHTRAKCAVEGCGKIVRCCQEMHLRGINPWS